MKIRAVLAALAVTVGLTAFAVAGSNAPALAAACYDNAVTVAYDGIGVYPENSQHWTTSPRCNDINMRVAGGSVSACVIFIDHTQDCNHWTTVGTGWVTIATNVKDYTNFQVGVEGDDRELGIDMYVAF